MGSENQPLQGGGQQSPSYQQQQPTMGGNQSPPTPHNMPPQQYGQPYQPAYNQQPYLGNPYEQQQQPQQPIYYNQPGQPQQPYGQPPQQYTNPVYNATIPGYNVDPYQQPNYSDNQPLIQPIAMPAYVYHETCEKFPSGPVYQDVMYTILFVLHLVALVIVGIISRSRQFVYLDTYNYGYIFALLVISAVTSAIYVYAWMRLAHKHPKPVLHVTFIANIVLSAILTIVTFAIGAIYLGVIMAIITFVCAIFYIVWRKRIDFTASLLQTAIELVQRFPATMRIGFIVLVVNFIWLIIWGSILHRVVFTFNNNSAGFYFVFIFLIFSFYWVANVLKNIVHVTVSGLYATWYFMDGSVGMPQNPTMKSFKRAMTTSFGSICFGSLLIAIVSTLRYVSDMMMGSKNGIVQLLGCILGCVLSLAEGVLRLMNVYAYTQVAIYGKGYCQSARDTWELFKNRGADLIVNDNFISTALTMSILFGACIGGLVGLGFGAIYGSSVGSGILTFATSFTFVLVALETLYSGVVSIFVCFMMEPQILRQQQPTLYDIYVSNYNKLIL